MKKILSVSFIICLTLITFACSKDDDPVDNDFFVGTYKGHVEYHNDQSDKSSDNGKVTVIKVASKTKYNFEFSDGIPNLNGIEFEEEGDNRLINVGFEEGVQSIKISESSLKMFYTNKDGEVWVANVER